MAQMDTAQMEEFLERTRQAILMTANADGTPNGIPVWFEWDGAVVRMFAQDASPKIARIERDPRISVLVTNDTDEAPSWVRFEGTAAIDRDSDGFVLAERLANRYWDLDDPGYAAVVDQWREAPAGALVTILLQPERIRSSAS